MTGLSRNAVVSSAPSASDACARTLRNPSVVEGMTRAAHPIRYLGRVEFGAYVRAEAAKYAALIKASGLRQAD